MRIYLIGLPGSGKTTLGKQVAKALKLTFIDMDDEIVKSEGKSISDIFSKEGEAYFREIERAMLHKVAQRRKLYYLHWWWGSLFLRQYRLHE